MKRTSSEHSRATHPSRVSKGQMLAATSAFLVLAILLLYGFIHLLRLVAQRELFQTSKALPSPTPQAPSAALTYTISPNPEILLETGSQLAQMLEQAVPEDTSSDTENSPAHIVPSLENSSILTTNPAPTPPQRARASFTRSRMDLVVLGFDGAGKLDMVSLMVLRKDGCTFFFLPENLIDGTGQPLSRLTNCEDTLAALETVLPVDLEQYVFVETDRIGDCVDALGGIQVDGVSMDGATAMALCANDGSDSLIRLSRMQGLTRGAAAALKQVSIFRLSALKDALLDAGGGSPTREAYLSLYLSLRALDESRIHTRLLPIDSIIVDGKRCYRLDSAAAAEVLKEYYPL